MVVLFLLLLAVTELNGLLIRRGLAVAGVFAINTVISDISKAAPLPTVENVVAKISASTEPQCDEKCRQKIQDRRTLMRQSKSTSSRQEVFDLSRQRANLYGVESKAASCIKGIPCI